jgi:hypothetical protein
VHIANADGAGVTVVATGPSASMLARGRSLPGMRCRVGDEKVGDRTGMQLLVAIAGELESRGLRVRPSDRRGMVTEIAASSPRHPERGAVRIGYDGFLIWERWAPAADGDRAAEILRLIARVLYGEGLASAGDPR